MSVKKSVLAMSLCAGFIGNACALPGRFMVPECKYQTIKDKVRLLQRTNSFSLIEATLSDALLQQLRSNEKACGKFIDMEPWEAEPQHPLATRAIQQYVINHETDVTSLLNLVDIDSLWQTARHLTSYVNRSANSKSGVAAAHWYKEQFDRMAREQGRQDVDSYFVKTGKKYRQPSVVTVIGKDKPGEAIVLGAHIDTLSGHMPGADDDASGIAVTLEISRVLLSSGLEVQHPVYIIAYAAEEQGLVGSGYVVQSFLQKGTAVKAVMQFDQAGFRAHPEDNTIWLLDDYVDPSLTAFTADLLTRYVQVPVAYTHCGYGCSDHANWTMAGFRATYPSATTLDEDNPYMHSSEDALDILNLEHMQNFTKLGLAFATELALE